MQRIEALKNLIDILYQEKRKGRDSWAEYLYTKHIFLVADCAQSLTERFGGKAELAVAGSMLHDIADAVMSRFDIHHESEGENIARDFLTQSGFSDVEIEIVVGDIIRNHSCRGKSPVTQEGKIMATADAVVHLTSDFYEHAFASKIQEGESRENITKWALQKIERDFKTKIFFDEIREQVRLDYEKCKRLFG